MKNFLSSMLLLLLITTPQAVAQKQKNVVVRPERVIRLNATDTAGNFNTMFKECIGAGRANEGLRADWQKQLSIVKKECGFKYIRMHGLLSDDMGVYREDEKGNPEYNFQYIDALYDFLLSIGIKPFVELGFMPSAMATGNKVVFWWRGNITPPKDYDKWAALIRSLVQHFTDRYGTDEVKSWYFEVWNEPNLKDGFWSSTQEEYFKLYRYAAEAVKTVNPAYRVGGPATAGADWVPETIDFCVKNGVPIDFISTHAYGVKHGYLDQFGTSGTILDKDDWSVSKDVLNSRKQIQESARPNLELHYTEWSSSYTPADPIHDSYHQASYILQKLKQVGDAPNSMSYWVFTDIFEESGPRFTPFHGGFGLMNTQGIKKPAYFAYSFLNKMGETELKNPDKQSWACKDKRGGVQLLLWDFTNTHPGDSVLNQMYYVRDLPAKSKGMVKIEIEGLIPGNYQLEVYQIGYRVNDAYSTYLSLGKPRQLSREQVKAINTENSGAPVSTEIVRVDAKGAFFKELPLRENDVYQLKLVKM